MFCNQCGTQLRPDYNLCPKCGAPVARAAAAPTQRACGQSRLSRHVRTLGTLWIILGALWLIPSAALMTMGHVIHLARLGPFPGEFATPLLFTAGYVFLLVAALGVCVGWGLMQHQPWARTAAIVLGILALFRFPFGTALGVYTLWVLLSNGADVEYERLGPSISH